MADQGPTVPIPQQVPLAQRYTAAWAEINTRLVSRQTVSLYAAAAAVTVTSLIVGSITGPQADSFLLGGWADGLCAGLVVLSWTFALWIRHNDATIGLLSAFCRSLEMIDDPMNTDGLPAWHNESQGWIVRARRYRRYSDRAFIGITAIAAMPSAIVCTYHFVMSSWAAGLLILPVIAAGLWAVWFTYGNAALREEIAGDRFNNSSGVWAFTRP
jgi:hypothetical protein